MRDPFYKSLCAMFVDRSIANNLTGKKRDLAASDFFAGVYAGLLVVGSPDADKVGILLMLVSVRGYSEVAKLTAS